jgi:TonB family protein
MRLRGLALSLVLSVPSAAQPLALTPTASSKPALVAYELGSPMYPERAQMARMRGTVLVSAVVTPGGVTRSIIVSGPVNPWLDRSCVLAVEHTRPVRT